MQLHRKLVDAVVAVESLNLQFDRNPNTKLRQMDLIDRLIYEGQSYTALLREAIRQLEEK